MSSTSSTTTSSTLPLPICGNSLRELPEECDDGNRADGDGCSAACHLECPGGVTGAWKVELDALSFLFPYVLTLSEDGGGTVRGVRYPAGLPGRAVTITGMHDAGGLPLVAEGAETGRVTLVACGRMTLHGLGATIDLTLVRTTTAICGDGTLDEGEVCDDGNFENADGCNVACAAPACADGIRDPGEDCDDGNVEDGDGCPATCRLECPGGLTGTWELDSSGLPFPLPFLFPYILTLSEAVDGQLTGVRYPPGIPGFALPVRGMRDGFAVTLVANDSETGTAMLMDCGRFLLHGLGATTVDVILVRTTTAICGDGAVDAGEVCDDGNFVNADGCNVACAASVCQNGVREPGEDCDDGNAVQDDLCANDCRRTCGNAVREPGEACDDGNLADGDGCSAACELECPDGLTGTWMGDDFPLVLNVLESPAGILTVGASPLGAPDSSVVLEGMRHGANVTLSGAFGPISGLRVACDRLVLYQVAAVRFTRIATRVCGDGTLEPPELCDDGNFLNGDACTAACTPAACGNGIVEPGEECDDGNRLDGDTCTADCRVESPAGSATTGTPQTGTRAT